MKKFGSLILFAALAIGCGEDTTDKTARTPDPAPVTGTEQLAAKAAAKLIEQFSHSLKNELMAAIKAGGPENAIEVCQSRAPEITLSYSQHDWTIKRVSEKNRNPVHAANEGELAMLARFTDTTGEVPPFIDEWIETETGRVYRYYKPIRTGTLCLKCHGQPEKISNAVTQVLADKYPQDKATGYGPGELRGMFVVQTKWPEGKPFADSLVKADR